MDVAAPPPVPLGELMADPEREYAELFTTQWPRLYRMAVVVAGDHSVAEDAVQTAMAKAYASWTRVRAADHPEAYLRRMVLNEIVGARRTGWFRRERTHGQVDPGLTTAAQDDVVADRDAVWAAVLALPVRQRAVIVLRYYEDLSEREIAEVLGCSRGTVKSQASAALANLRRAGAGIDDPEGEEER